MELNTNIAVIMSLFVTDSLPLNLPWYTELVSFVRDSLAGDGSRVKTSVADSISDCIATLPILLVSANQRSSENVSSLLEAFSTFYMSTSATSHAKKTCLSFLSRLFLAQAGSADSSICAMIPDSLKTQWILSFPKLLWVLRSNAPETTEDILILLRKIVVRLPSVEMKKKLLDTLTPLLYVTMPGKLNKPAQSVCFS